METVFKIRQKSTGLFAKGGGTWGKFWVEAGKIWRKKHHAEAHIRNNLEFYRAEQDDVELIQYQLVEVEVSDGRQVVSPVDEKQLEQERVEDARREVWKRERLEAERQRIDHELFLLEQATS